MDAGGAGVAEKIEEVPACRQFTDQVADQAVVQEEPSVEIVLEIDQKLEALLLDLEEAPLAVQAFVLLLAALAATHTQKEALAGNTQHLGDDPQGLPEPATGVPRIDAGGGLVLLDVGDAFAVQGSVEIEGEVIFGQVGVVKPETGHALALPPFIQGL